MERSQGGRRAAGARWLACWVAMAAALLLAGPALAANPTLESMDEISPDSIQETYFRSFRIPGLRGALISDITANADYGNSEITAVESGARLTMLIPATERLGFRLETRGSYRFHDFDGTSALISSSDSNPFGPLLTYQLRGGGRYLFGGGFGAELGGFFNARTEWRGAFSEGITGGGLFALAYTWEDRLTLVGGFGVGSRMIRDGARVSPYFRFSWRVTDRVRIASEGAGGRVTVKVAKPLRVSVFGGVDGTRWRLKDDADRRDDDGNPIGKGAVSHRQVRVGFGVRWRPHKRVRLFAETGAVPWARYRIVDDDADTVDRRTLNETAWFGTLRFEYRF